jgi:ribonuclease PH
MCDDIVRFDGRRPGELRQIEIEPGFLKNCPGSAIIKFGNTRVLCAASISKDIPPWMKREENPGGWITAEYQMLPASTIPRGRREKKGPSGRSQEIQRLVGRSLRGAVDLQALGPRMINIDCEVLDADGGTRCASITGAMVALRLALDPLLKNGELLKNPILNNIAAVSVGIVNGKPLLDLCYEEDSKAEVDMNIVITEDMKLIEVQGTAEGAAFSRDELNQMLDIATPGFKIIFDAQNKAVEAYLA